MSLHWDHDNALSQDMDSMSSHMPHGPLIIHSPCSFGCCIHTHALLSLFGKHMGVINALEELVTDYGRGYMLLFGPWDDVA
jgi:hypothetical protein